MKKNDYQKWKSFLSIMNYYYESGIYDSASATKHYYILVPYLVFDGHGDTDDSLLLIFDKNGWHKYFQIIKKDVLETGPWKLKGDNK